MSDEPSTGVRATVKKKKRERSPNYPGIDLDEALNRARTIERHEGRHSAPARSILSHWGYGENSGSGLVIFAALKKFGLLIEEGSGAGRKGRLSDDAIAIIKDEREDSPDRLRRIQEAALRPPIHTELWERYGSELPSDETLRYELQVEKGFTERAVGDFIPQYKRTIEFAELAERGKLSSDDEDSSPTPKRDEVLVTPPANAQAVSLPLAAGEFATLQAAFPLTIEKWKRLVAVLSAMRPALVTGETTDDLEAGLLADLDSHLDDAEDDA